MRDEMIKRADLRRSTSNQLAFKKEDREEQRGRGYQRKNITKSPRATDWQC